MDVIYLIEDNQFGNRLFDFEGGLKDFEKNSEIVEEKKLLACNWENKIYAKTALKTIVYIKEKNLLAVNSLKNLNNKTFSLYRNKNDIHQGLEMLPITKRWMLKLKNKKSLVFQVAFVSFIKYNSRFCKRNKKVANVVLHPWLHVFFSFSLIFVPVLLIDWWQNDVQAAIEIKQFCQQNF